MHIIPYSSAVKLAALKLFALESDVGVCLPVRSSCSAERTIFHTTKLTANGNENIRSKTRILDVWKFAPLIDECDLIVSQVKSNLISHTPFTQQSSTQGGRCGSRSEF